MSFDLPALPYAKDALAPVISERTMDFHHGKHHAAYVSKLNGFVEQKPDYAGKSLEEVIKLSHAQGDKGVFNNAAQVWNHTFFWHSMTPNGGGKPSGDLAAAIDKAFGSFADFRQKFIDAGVGQFGSGWVWLVEDQGALKIVATANAELPLTQGQKALLTCDVWEHAYYLDYQNVRPAFLEAFMDKLANWEFAAKNFAA